MFYQLLSNSLLEETVTSDILAFIVIMGNEIPFCIIIYLFFGHKEVIARIQYLHNVSTNAGGHFSPLLFDIEREAGKMEKQTERPLSPLHCFLQVGIRGLNLALTCANNVCALMGTPERLLIAEFVVERLVGHT